ncbi:MAG TPA: hypothetical protein DCQ97_12595 [Chitinophagaceae bacterium]|nr:hypothetical protein [Chitinophagaceae bacterium]
MSLDNIQLTPIVLEGLFSKSLYDLKPAGIVSFLGENRRKIAVLVRATAAMYLPEDELNFLAGILTACKLSMADIALINVEKNTGLSYTLMTDQVKAETVLLFGVDLAELSLPLQFPHYQLQHFNNQVYLSSVPLQVLQADKQEKMKLWNSLKKVFSLT